MKPSPIYEYGDGSANRYTITATTLTYDPVKPEESSTGMYSGGDPAEVALTPDQYNRLRDLFDAAINHTEIHISERIKTSGMITRTLGTETSTVILKPQTAELEEIERVLRDLRLQK
jgi:hypothetical protein